MVRNRLHITPPYVVWILLVVVLSATFIFLNPPLPVIISRLWPLVLAGAFLISYAGWGAIPGFYLAQGKSGAIQFLTSTAIGFGLVGLMVMAAGIAGILGSGVVILWTLIGWAMAVISFHRWGSLSFKIRIRGFWDVIGIIILGCILVIDLPYVVSPEVSYDALTYHLLVPKMYLGMGRIEWLPFLMESNYPLLAEFCYLPILSLSGEIACKSLHFVVCLLLLCCMALFVRRIRGQNGGWIAPALFLCMPAVVAQSGWAWNDFFFTYFLLLSIYFLYEYHVAPPPERQTRDLFAAGVLLGLAAATKYSFAIFIGPFILICIIGMRRWNWKKEDFLYMLLPAILVPAPWLLKNWIYTGNPTFPLFNSFFGSRYWTESLADYFQKSISRSYIENVSGLTHVLFPLELMLKPRVIDIHVGILPIAFLPLFFWMKFKGRNLLILLIVSLFVSWICLQTGTRTAFIFFAVLMVLYSVALYQRFSDRGWKRWVIVVILGVGLSLNLILSILNTYGTFHPLAYFLGRESDTEYITREVSSQRAYDYLNALPEVGNVLLVSLHDPLYLRQVCYFSGRHDQPIAEIVAASVGSKEEMLKKLIRMNVTHVAIQVESYRTEHENGLYRWDSVRKAAFEDLLKERCRQMGRWENDVVLQCRFSER